MSEPNGYIVIQPQIVGNLESWSTAYYWDGTIQTSRVLAVSHGWEVHGHDDWLIGLMKDRRLFKLAWMDEDRDDPDELAEAAAALCLEVAA